MGYLCSIWWTIVD